MPSLPTTQEHWRWCKKCQGLFYAGVDLGTCPAGDRHDDSASGNYRLIDNSILAYGQADWRWCGKCRACSSPALLSARVPRAQRTTEPVAASTRWSSNSPYDEPQRDWRWCNKCQGLFSPETIWVSALPEIHTTRREVGTTPLLGAEPAVLAAQGRGPENATGCRTGAHPPGARRPRPRSNATCDPEREDARKAADGNDSGSCAARRRRRSMPRSRPRAPPWLSPRLAHLRTLRRGPRLSRQLAAPVSRQSLDFHWQFATLHTWRWHGNQSRSAALAEPRRRTRVGAAGSILGGWPRRCRHEHRPRDACRAEPDGRGRGCRRRQHPVRAAVRASADYGLPFPSVWQPEVSATPIPLDVDVVLDPPDHTATDSVEIVRVRHSEFAAAAAELAGRSHIEYTSSSSDEAFSSFRQRLASFFGARFENRPP